MRQLPLCALAVVAISACGAYSVAPAESPSPSSDRGYAVVLTQQDHSATLQVGQKLEVVLGTPAGGVTWSHPRSSDQAVLAPTVDPAATAVRGVTLAAFIARSPGQATLTANGSPQCSPGQACPMYAVLFSAVVTVTG
jgi:hypothetical protein